MSDLVCDLVSDFSRTPMAVAAPSGTCMTARVPLAGGVRLKSDTARRRPPASVLALVLALLAELASVTLVLGSDSDPGGVRWWLVLAPALLAAVPVVAPVHSMRVGVGVALAAWTALASASIGLFFLPATVAALVAARPARDAGVRPKSDTVDGLGSHP